MKNNKVRCWKFFVENSEAVFASYPEDNSGYDLVCCLNCGQIYAVGIEKEVYGGIDRHTQSKNKHCIRCGNSIDGLLKSYPEHYLSLDGSIHRWVRPKEFPTFDSEIKEFPDLFSI